MEDAKATLRIGDIMGQVQHGRGGLGPSSTEEADSQQGAKAGGEDKVCKDRFPGQAEKMDEMEGWGTTHDRLARPMDNGTEQDQFPHQINI
ncbi:UNVERIFIED_CONTAM: hypothetical protein FKN15_055421 [Acipenser sinensis]